ncbi:MAG: dihydroorotate dehydrogenase [Fimbriimonadaceae bacterium]|jgi:dihydroorotate dehydrogenase|nr:dihydroorotate dehydrogenase [Fimbriimonadaceae bacterium]
MGLYQAALRPLLFRMDPESAHDLAFKALERGAVTAKAYENEALHQTVFGLLFKNPLGLAAGFDKNARAVPHWHRLGFGHVEVGTVTWHPQPGNPKPRLFRLPEDKALINRMGFNNDGAEAVAERLSKSDSHIPLGINLGKSKVTPLEQAADDYQKSFRAMEAFGDYFVVNVSSPNTPGLRSLQERGPLAEIFSALRGVSADKPLFVKVAPDLELTALDEVVQVAAEHNLTGIVATNTTISREQIPSGRTHRDEAGGLSGQPIFEMSNKTLAHLYRTAPKEMVLIGVGGVFTGRDLYDKIAHGAHLAQVYTGWIYGGPQMAPRCLAELASLLEREGISDLAELRGMAAGEGVRR